MTLEAIVTSLTLGLAASASPCIIPLYPGFLAYLSGGQEALSGKRGRYYLGFFVLAGVLVMMLVLGAVIAALSISVGKALTVIIPLADIAIIGLGILLLANINPFKRLPQIKVPLLSNPYVNAFVYGLLYGPIALPCSGPLVVAIFALSFTAEEFLGKLWVFLLFGIGFGLPLFLLSFLSGASQRWITRIFAQHSRAINAAAGLLLIAVGIYDLVVNWENLRLFL
jgi:cytochrome c-type biogenesis protein